MLEMENSKGVTLKAIEAAKQGKGVGPTTLEHMILNLAQERRAFKKSCVRATL